MHLAPSSSEFGPPNRRVLFFSSFSTGSPLDMSHAES